MMMVDKKDAVTVLVLTFVFFVVAAWALGRTTVPVTGWQSESGDVFYVDLGGLKDVRSVYFLLKRGSINVTLYSGYPGEWSVIAEASMNDYYKWKEVRVDQATRFIRFGFPSSNGVLDEVAVLGSDGSQIRVASITDEGSDGSLTSLVDEQDKVEVLPTYMSETVFDEVYYVRTAEEYLNLSEPYEWTHPPLGKLMIAGGVLAFGFDPFGWRILEVVFGALMVPVMYFFGKRLFGTWIGAFSSAFLLVFDFMHFTMARVALLDTFAVFFSLLSQFFFFVYLKKVLKDGWKTTTLPLLVAVVFFALGFSTKWNAVLGFVADLFILVVLRVRDVAAVKGLAGRVRVLFGHPFLSLLVFLVVAVDVYLLTFVPYMLVGHSLGDVLGLQWDMFRYHSTLVATHPFSSVWWSWPLISRPVWFHVSNMLGNMVSTVVCMGNPAVWWVGLACVGLAVEEGVRRRDSVLLFVGTVFLFQWLSYAVVSRVSFLYYFYFDVPFLIFATAYFISKVWNMRWGKMMAVAYLTVVALLFAVFYPVISGMPVAQYWRDSLRWFGSWTF